MGFARQNRLQHQSHSRGQSSGSSKFGPGQSQLSHLADLTFGDLLSRGIHKPKRLIRDRFEFTGISDFL